MKILLADDEKGEREGIIFLLNKFGYSMEVEQAVNGKKALEYLENHPGTVDILFTDVKMPFMDGLELAQNVSKKYPEIKIIIFSAYGEFSYAKKAMEANAVDYLLKPIEIDEFKRVMDEVIKSIASNRETQQRDRENIFYKCFTGGRLTADETELLHSVILDSRNNAARVVNFSFSSNVFENGEEQFSHFVKMYFGAGAEVFQMFGDEAFVILDGRDNSAKDQLEKQMKRLLQDLQQFIGGAPLVVIGQVVHSIDELIQQMPSFEKVKEEIFGYDNQIVWLGQSASKVYYVTDINTIQKNLIAELKDGNKELLQKLWKQLMDTVKENDVLSRIYTHNVFYTVIHEAYNQFPQIDRNRVLEAADQLFTVRNTRVMLEQFDQIWEQVLDVLPDNEDEQRSTVTAIKKMVEMDYDKDIGLNDIAEKVNLTPAYVSYIFKRETGQTLIKYITDMKMERAKSLLEDSHLKIVEIGRMCGYENQSYFNRMFKNYYGMTPKQFREDVQ